MQPLVEPRTRIKPDSVIIIDNSYSVTVSDVDCVYLGGAVDGESGVSVEAGHARHVDDAACKKAGR